MRAILVLALLALLAGAAYAWRPTRPYVLRWGIKALLVALPLIAMLLLLRRAKSRVGSPEATDAAVKRFLDHLETSAKDQMVSADLELSRRLLETEREVERFDEVVAEAQTLESVERRQRLIALVQATKRS